MSDTCKQDAQACTEADKAHVWHHLVQHQPFAEKPPMIVVEGKGLRIKDMNGREYLDATSGGVWCVNVGYGQDRIADAVCAQLKKMPYYAASAGSVPASLFSAKLIEHMPGLNRVYISNSGSEANEKAYKMVRALAHLSGNPAKKTILFRQRDYHGTTIGALSSCGQQERKEYFGPFAEGFAEFPHASCYRCAFNKTYPGCDIDCARSVERIIEKLGPENVGGVVCETITAGGGIIPPVPEYYLVLSEICRKHGVLTIMDEVVCGMGRTGAMFGYQHYNFIPDMVTMAKGLASAYMPISATVTTEAVFQGFVHDAADKLAYFRDISTFGGCAGGCAAALENLKIIEEDKLLANVVAMGQRMMDGLEELRALPWVGDVRGKGLLGGVELVEDKASRKPLAEAKVVQVVAQAAADGVLLGRTNRCLPGYNNVVNMAPAYVATADDIDTIVSALKKAIEKVHG